MNCVSLFSGCGGLDLGIVQAGFRQVFANDIDPIMASSHRANLGEEGFFCGSVSKITSSLLRRVSGGKAIKGKVDLLIGGPPCPPYSKSRFYRKNKPRALEDPIATETLKGYLKVLRILQPRAFLFENVHGFAYKIHADALKYLQAAVSKQGYICSPQVINSADYGVPQIRERFFLIGMKGKRFEFPPQTHAKNASGLPSWSTAGDAIGSLDTEKNADDTGHFAGGRHHALLRKVPPGDNYLYFTKERGYSKPLFKWRSRYWSFLLKLSPSRPSWTIQARRSNNMGPLHWRNRILRIQEVKRLQTFPDKWTLKGSIEQQWRQVGNAVPPLLARRLGEAIRDQLASGVLRNGRKRLSPASIG